jgi:hypothetical protein
VKLFTTGSPLENEPLADLARPEPEPWPDDHFDPNELELSRSCRLSDLLIESFRVRLASLLLARYEPIMGAPGGAALLPKLALRPRRRTKSAHSSLSRRRRVLSSKTLACSAALELRPFSGEPGGVIVCAVS